MCVCSFDFLSDIHQKQSAPQLSLCLEVFASEG